MVETPMWEAACGKCNKVHIFRVFDRMAAVRTLKNRDWSIDNDELQWTCPKCIAKPEAKAEKPCEPA